jgi:PKD repeat protein
MTWGRKNGDASNCAAYPPICTYNGMQQRLRESYLEMAMTNNATCAPAGVAWKKVRDTYPLIELYNADESHPSVSGTYLVACTFYSSLYHRSSVGSTYIPSGLLATDATNLQTIGSNTVLDSLENWQQDGSLPKANYSSSNIQNQFSFTNQSVRSTQYEWNFGDGSAISTTASPIHSFTATGNYTVTLKAKNTCGHYDLMSKSLTVSSVPNGTNDVNISEPNNVSYASQCLTINNIGHVNNIRIVNLFGQVIKDATITNGLNKISFTAVQGVYLYTLLSGNNIVRVGKFTVN